MATITDAYDEITVSSFATKKKLQERWDMRAPNTVTRFTLEFDFLSNFYASPILVAGIVYPTVEHAFQAIKSKYFKERYWISKLKNPAAAKVAGRNVKLRARWDEIKLDVMYSLLKLKFKIPALRYALLTMAPDQILVEGNMHHDSYWGTSATGFGKNWLGKLLMKLRKAIQRTERAKKGKK